MFQPSDPEIKGPVLEAFVEALGLEEDEVDFDAKVIEELGAESLDLLDIVFRLERSFDIKIPRGGIEQDARSSLESGEPLEINGTLTALGLSRLADAMPEVPADEFVEGLKVSEIPLLFRVSTFARLVCQLVDERDAESVQAIG